MVHITKGMNIFRTEQWKTIEREWFRSYATDKSRFDLCNNDLGDIPYIRAIQGHTVSPLANFCILHHEDASGEMENTCLPRRIFAQLQEHF